MVIPPSSVLAIMKNFGWSPISPTFIARFVNNKNIGDENIKGPVQELKSFFGFPFLIDFLENLVLFVKLPLAHFLIFQKRPLLLNSYFHVTEAFFLKEVTNEIITWVTAFMVWSYMVPKKLPVFEILPTVFNVRVTSSHKLQHWYFHQLVL